MADETTEQPQVQEPAEAESSVDASEPTIIGVNEPAVSRNTIALNRTAEGGLSFKFAFDIPAGPYLSTFPKWTHQQLINGALIAILALVIGFVVYAQFFAASPEPAGH